MQKTVWLWILILGVACAGPVAPEDAARPGWGDYSIQLPGGWKELDFPDGTLITKDGAFSQYIMVQQRPIEKPFQTTGRVLAGSMEPQDVAEVLMHEMEADTGVIGFQLVEYSPASVSGRDGFRMVFRYRTRAGIPFKTYYYGLMSGGWFYNLRYNSDEGKFTAEDLETFARLVSSFRIAGAGSK
jgi:hypothetical protein